MKLTKNALKKIIAEELEEMSQAGAVTPDVAMELAPKLIDSMLNTALPMLPETSPVRQSLQYDLRKLKEYLSAIMSAQR